MEILAYRKYCLNQSDEWGQVELVAQPTSAMRSTHLHARLLHATALLVRLLTATAAAAQSSPPRLFHAIIHVVHAICHLLPLAQREWPAGASFHFLLPRHILPGHRIFFLIARFTLATA
jgi:hypothetical protein